MGDAPPTEALARSGAATLTSALATAQSSLQGSTGFAVGGNVLIDPLMIDRHPLAASDLLEAQVIGQPVGAAGSDAVPGSPPFPLVAAYTASKTAVEGFTASLALELAEFGVRAKLVEPGYCPDTRFAENGTERMHGLITDPYAPFAQSIFEGFSQLAAFTRPIDVARAAWHAANDASGRMHFAAGEDAIALTQRKV